jgi:hypothetical protein
MNVVYKMNFRKGKTMQYLNTNYSSGMSQQKNPTFGILIMDEAKIAKRAGRNSTKVLNELKMSRPLLEEEGKRADILVLSPTDNPTFQHYEGAFFYIKQLGSQQKNHPIFNFFSNFFSDKSKPNPPSGFISFADKNLGDTLVTKVKQEIDKFLEK